MYVVLDVILCVQKFSVCYDGLLEWARIEARLGLRGPGYQVVLCPCTGLYGLLESIQAFSVNVSDLVLWAPLNHHIQVLQGLIHIGQSDIAT